MCECHGARGAGVVAVAAMSALAAFGRGERWMPPPPTPPALATLTNEARYIEWKWRTNVTDRATGVDATGARDLIKPLSLVILDVMDACALTSPKFHLKVAANTPDAILLKALDMARRQAHPEKCENLQVRVCGWNVRWNDLSRAEQNAYILRAENIAL